MTLAGFEPAQKSATVRMTQNATGNVFRSYTMFSTALNHKTFSSYIMFANFLYRKEEAS